METKKTSDDYLIFFRVAMAFDSGLGSSINTTFFCLFSLFFKMTRSTLWSLDSQVFMTCSQKTSLFLSLTTQLTVTLETLSNILMKPP